MSHNHNHSHVHIHKHEVEGRNLVYSIFLNLLITIAINHINIQPEFKKEDPKDFIVQD